MYIPIKKKKCWFNKNQHFKSLSGSNEQTDKPFKEGVLPPSNSLSHSAEWSSLKLPAFILASKDALEKYATPKMRGIPPNINTTKLKIPLNRL